MSNHSYKFGQNLIMEKKAFIGGLANVGLSIASPYILGSLGKQFSRQLALKTMTRMGARGAIRGATTAAKLGNQEAMDAMIAGIKSKGASPLPSAFEAFNMPKSIRGLAADPTFQKNLLSNGGKMTNIAGKFARGLEHPATGIAAMLGTSVMPVFPQGTTANVQQQF